MEKHVVVFYEGLGGTLQRTLQKGLIKKLKKQFPNVKFEYRIWDDKSPLPENVIMVIGHSFGGYWAMQALRRFQQKTHLAHKIRLVTIDPRYMPKTPMISPLCREHLNFRQRLPLAGREVKGAKNMVIRQFIPILGHMFITRNKKVVQAVKDQLSAAVTEA